MIDAHYWPDCPAEELAQWVLGYLDEHHTVGYDTHCHPAFIAYAKERLQTSKLRFFASVIEPNTIFGGAPLDPSNPNRWLEGPSCRAAYATRDHGRWVEGMPHWHGWNDSRAMITCVQAPDEGGELFLWDHEGYASRWLPVVGMSVLFPMGEHDAYAHAVTRVESGQRIMLVACT